MTEFLDYSDKMEQEVEEEPEYLDEDFQALLNKLPHGDIPCRAFQFLVANMVNLDPNVKKAVGESAKRQQDLLLKEMNQMLALQKKPDSESTPQNND